MKKKKKTHAKPVQRQARAEPSPNGCATKIDTLDRKMYVADLMSRGYGAEESARELATKCDLSIGRARVYVADVRNEWAEMEQSERATRRAQCLKLLETGARIAIESRNVPALNGAVREIARITGLDVKESLITGGIASLQAQILARLADAKPGDGISGDNVEESEK